MEKLNHLVWIKQELEQAGKKTQKRQKKKLPASLYFELSGNLDYPFSIKAGPTCSAVSLSLVSWHVILLSFCISLCHLFCKRNLFFLLVSRISLGLILGNAWLLRQEMLRSDHSRQKLIISWIDVQSQTSMEHWGYSCVSLQHFEVSFTQRHSCRRI